MTALNISIEQLTADKLQAQCTHWEDFPRPGDYIDFLTQAGGHFYTRIEAVYPVQDNLQSLRLTLIPALGSPDIRIAAAVQMSQKDFFKIQQPKQSPKVPFALQDLVFDLSTSGQVLYVKPNELGIHHELLKSFKAAGAPLLIIDPVGINLEELALPQVRMGSNHRLSLQEVGVKHFVEWVVEGLPQAVQEEASEFLLSLVPPTPDFIPIQYFVSHPLLKNHPLSSAILHQLYTFHTARIFASSMSQMLSLQSLEEGRHVNLSSYASEFLPLVYEGLLRMVSRRALPREAQVVLVAPEIDAKATLEFANRTKHRVILISQVSKPWDAVITDRWEETHLFGQEGLGIKGQITDGFNLFIPYSTGQIVSYPSVTSELAEQQAARPIIQDVKAPSLQSDLIDEMLQEAQFVPQELPEVEPMDAVEFPREDSEEIALFLAAPIESEKPLYSPAPETVMIENTALSNMLAETAEAMASSGEAFSLEGSFEIPDLDFDSEPEESPEQSDVEALPEEPVFENTPLPPEIAWGLESFTAQEEDPSGGLALSPNDFSLDRASLLEVTPAEEPPVESITPEDVNAWALETLNSLGELPAEPERPPTCPPTEDFMNPPLTLEFPEAPVVSEDVNDWALEALNHLYENTTEENLSRGEASKSLRSLQNDLLGMDFDWSGEHNPFEALQSEVDEVSNLLGTLQQQSVDSPEPTIDWVSTPSAALSSVDSDILPSLQAEIASVDERGAEESPGMTLEIANTDELQFMSQSNTLLNIDFSVLTPVSPDSNGLYALVEKDIPSISYEMPVLDVAQDENSLEIEAGFGTLDTEESLLGSMAPDLLETVHEKTLDAYPRELEMKPEVQTDVTRVYEKMYTDVSDDNQNALDFLLSLNAASEVQSVELTEVPPSGPLETHGDEVSLSSGGEMEWSLAFTNNSSEALAAEVSQEALSSTYDLSASLEDSLTLPPLLDEDEPQGGGLGEETFQAPPDIPVFDLTQESIVDPSEPPTLINPLADDYLSQLLAEAQGASLPVMENPNTTVHPKQEVDFGEAVMGISEEDALVFDFDKPDETPQEPVPPPDPLALDDWQGLSIPEDSLLQPLPVNSESSEFNAVSLDFSLPNIGEDLGEASASLSTLEEIAFDFSSQSAVMPEDLTETRAESSEPVYDFSDVNPAAVSAEESLSDKEIENLLFNFSESLMEDVAAPAPQPVASAGSDPLDYIFNQGQAGDTLQPTFDIDFQEAQPVEDMVISLGDELPDFSMIELEPTLHVEPSGSYNQPTATSSTASSLPIYKTTPQLAPATYNPGDQVFHKRYGQGVIKRVITMDDQQVILNINFEGVGKRLLDPQLTQLEKVS